LLIEQSLLQAKNVMKFAALASVIVSVVGVAPSSIQDLFNAPEPVWLALWGIALLAVSASVRQASQPREPKKLGVANSTEAANTLAGMAETLVRPA